MPGSHPDAEMCIRDRVTVDRLEQTLATIVVDERARGLLVDVETVLDGLGLVVVALIHLTATLGAGSIGSGAGVTAGAAGATRRQTIDNDLGGHIDQKGAVDLATHRCV